MDVNQAGQGITVIKVVKLSFENFNAFSYLFFFLVGGGVRTYINRVFKTARN